MENGVHMAAEAYKEDVYKKEKTFVYEVPSDTHIAGYDHFPTDRADVERDSLSKATRNIDRELLQEFRVLMRHHRAGILRDEFVRCADESCVICGGEEPSAASELDKIIDRFPSGMLPSPIPALLPGDDHPSLTMSKCRSDALDCNGAAFDSEGPGCSRDTDPDRGNCAVSGNRRGRYRTFIDLLKVNLPRRCCYPDAFYEGEQVLHRCPVCPEPLEIFRTKTALDRHRKLCHTL